MEPLRQNIFGEVKRIRILHGPNVSYIGQGREPQWYGKVPWHTYYEALRTKYAHLTQLEYLESPHEGQLIQWVWEKNRYDGLIINPGALAHTSYALYEALRGCAKPCVEVHYSQIYKRERFRHRLITARACIGVISGFGWQGYEMALIALLNYEGTENGSGLTRLLPINPNR